MVVPTVYTECAHIAYREAISEDCEAIIALGQAGGRDGISVETVGVNYALAKLADNKGQVLYGEKLFDDGENAYFSSVPVKQIEEAVSALGFKCSLSVSAGGFVCNSMLYTLLRLCHQEGRNIKCGFIHLPYCESQQKNGFSMKDDDLAVCVAETIKTVIKTISERNNV